MAEKTRDYAKREDRYGKVYCGLRRRVCAKVIDEKCPLKMFKKQFNGKENISRSYIAVTPAKDEEESLPGLIESLAKQSIKPELWVAVDDGRVEYCWRGENTLEAT